MQKYKSLMIAICLFSLVGIALVPGCNCCKAITPGVIHLPEDFSAIKAGDTIYIDRGQNTIDVDFYTNPEKQSNKAAIFIVDKN